METERLTNWLPNLRTAFDSVLRLCIPYCDDDTHTLQAQLAVLRALAELAGDQPTKGDHQKVVCLYDWPIEPDTVQLLLGLPDWAGASLELSHTV